MPKRVLKTIATKIYGPISEKSPASLSQIRQQLPTGHLGASSSARWPWLSGAACPRLYEADHRIIETFDRLARGKISSSNVPARSRSFDFNLIVVLRRAWLLIQLQLSTASPISNHNVEGAPLAVPW